MKIFKHRNILGLIFGLMALIPLVSIGVKCAYVTVNKNAYESYSGNTELTYYERQEIQYPTSNNYLQSGKYYYLNGITLNALENYADNEQTALEFNLLAGYIEIEIPSGENLVYLTGDSYCYVYIEELHSDSSLDFYNLEDNYEYYLNITGYNDYNILFYGVIESNVTFQQPLTPFQPYVYENFPYLPQYTYEEKTLEQSNLDNVFEYSISEITKDSNLGNVGFFTWFAGMFLDLNNATNMLYIGFVNWYFNYLLLVSLGYVLFAVLMWFINYIRRLLEKGQDFGQGGY